MLYRQYYSFAMSVCLRYAPNSEDAREILNDGFLKVFDNIQEFDEDKPFKSWFRRILINTALDHYRANKKYRMQISFDSEEIQITDGQYLTEDFHLEADEILHIFQYLPELFRVIFNLYEVEGYSHQEIAGMLDIAPGTSRSHLSRAKKMLRKIYLDHRKKQRNEAV